MKETTNLALQVDETRLRQAVQLLSTIDPPRNFHNPHSLDRIAAFIERQMRQTGGRIERQEFRVKRNTYQNIICSFGPRDGARLIVGAHYDVCEAKPGADDNASGVAGVLELCRMLGSMDQRIFDKRIDLIAYTLEEPPNFGGKKMGSAIHAKALHRTGSTVDLMLSLEMIGFFSAEPDSQLWPLPAMGKLFPLTGDFIGVSARFPELEQARKVKALMMEGSNIGVEMLMTSSFVWGTGMSDHASYWKYGMPGVMITDTAYYRNEHYHKDTDTIDKLNFHQMAEVVRGTANVLLNW